MINTIIEVSKVGEMAGTQENRARSRDVLLGLLVTEVDSDHVIHLTHGINRLDPTAPDQVRAREALIGLLRKTTDPRLAINLAHKIADLEPTVEDRVHIREVLCGSLSRVAKYSEACNLVSAVTRMAVSEEERAQVREALFGPLYPAMVMSPYLTRKFAELAVSGDDRTQARRALLDWLAKETRPQEVGKLAEALVKLAITDNDRKYARELLLGLLAGGDPPTQIHESEGEREMAETDPRLFVEMVGRLYYAQDLSKKVAQLEQVAAGLEPTVKDLHNLENLPFRQTAALLGAVRRNSELKAWLAALRSASHPTAIAQHRTRPPRT